MTKYNFVRLDASNPEKVRMTENDERKTEHPALGTQFRDMIWHGEASLNAKLKQSPFDKLTFKRLAMFKEQDVGTAVSMTAYTGPDDNLQAIGMLVASKEDDGNRRHVLADLERFTEVSKL